MVRKNVAHRYQTDDRFRLEAVRDSDRDGPVVGDPVTTSGTASGVRNVNIGPVPILTRTIGADGSVTNSRQYYISEIGPGADLADCSTTLTCVGSEWRGNRTGVRGGRTQQRHREWVVSQFLFDHRLLDITDSDMTGVRLRELEDGTTIRSSSDESTSPSLHP